MVASYLIIARTELAWWFVGGTVLPHLPGCNPLNAPVPVKDTGLMYRVLKLPTVHEYVHCDAV